MSSPSRHRTVRIALTLITSIAVPLGVLWATLGSKADQNQEAIAPTVAATKVDTVFTDVDLDGRADPGDTLQYSITINNTGPDPATGVVFTDTLPNSLTLVGSANASPIGFDETYSATGNVRITVAAASGVLVNDIDPNTGNNTGLTASAGATSVNGGNVVMSSDGGFTYNPPPGFEGTDTFTYTVTDPNGATGTGTVSFTVSGMIWFVNAGAPAGGDGRLTSPFNCLTGAGCFDPVAAEGIGDNIFLYSGNYTGGVTLLNNQRLIGQGATASLSSITGITPPAGSDALPATGGARPVITTTLASTNGVNLASGNTLRGFNVANTTGIDLNGASVGTLAISEMDLNGTGRPLNLANGTLTATLDSLTATSAPGGAGVSLSSIGGTLTVSTATSITGAGGQGISVAGSSVAINFGTSTTVGGSATQAILIGTSTGDISFGNTTISGGTDGISLQNNSAGTRTFGTISVTNNTAVGFLHAVGGGTTTITGTATFTNPGTRCIDIQSSTTAVTFVNVTANQCGGTGVFLGTSSGAMTFADLDISPDATQRGLHASGNSGTITTTSGTIATTTGVGVEIAGTSAAVRTPINMQLTSVSSNGSLSGIVLTNTSAAGTPGGFTLVGGGGTCTSAATCTGGAIQNTTGNAVSIISATKVSLTRLFVANSQGHGINANAVNGTVATNGLNLTSCYISNSGNGDNEHGMNLTNASNTVTVDGTTFDGASEDLIHFENSNLNATFNVINTSRFINPATIGGFANAGILIHPNGTSAITTLIQGATFTNIKGVAAQIGSNVLGSNGTQSFTFSNNTMNVTISGRANGVVIAGQDSTVTNITINNNQFNGAGGNGVIGIDTNDSATVRGTVSTNTITTPPGIGMFVAVDEAGRNDVTLTGNTITNSGGDGIQAVNFGGAGVSNMDLVVTNNQINGHSLNTAVSFVGGISVSSFEDGTCLAHRGNSVTLTPAGPTQCGGASCVDHYMEEIGGTMTYEEVPDTANATLNAGYLNSINDPGPVTIFGVINLTNGASCNLVPLAGRENGGASPQQDVPTITFPNGSPKAQELLRRRQEQKRQRELERLQSVVFGFDNELKLMNTEVDWSTKFIATPSAQKNTAAIPSSETAIHEASTHAVLTTVAEKSSFAAEFLSRVVETIAPTVHSQKRRSDDAVKPDAIAPEAGETVTINGAGAGFTLPSGKSTTITFRATIGNPQPALTQVSNQGSVSGTNFSNVLTDDPDVAGSPNPTVTPVDHTTVVVTSNANPSVFGQNVTFTATMTGVPTRPSDPPGTVQFKVGGVNLGAPVPIVVGTASDNISTAQASISSLAIGNHVITAEYSGGGTGANKYNANIGTLSGGQTVGKANSATSVTSSQDPSVFGQAVTFTATVTPVSPAGGTPSGTINFLDGGNPIAGCQNVPLSSGQAICLTSALAVGSHTITTSYAGDTNFNSSTGNLTGNPQVVNKANSAVAITSSQNPTVIGQSVTFTAIVSAAAPGAGSPGGTVSFLDGGIAITGCQNLVLSSSQAQCSTSSLSLGSHTITATYSGDTNFNAGNGSMTGNPQVVIPAKESDVAVRPSGDGDVQSNDVIQVLRFLNEVDTPGVSSGEFQRADSAPRATRGNAVLDSADVIQTIRYLNEVDVMQDAGGPTAPAFAPFTESEPAASADAPSDAAVGAPEIRVESRNGTAGQMVTVNIRVDSLGTESQYAFSLNFDTTRLTYSSNSAGTTGALSSSCNLTATPGRVRCQIGSFPNNNPASSEPSIGEIPAGSNQLLIGVTFLIANGAATGPTNLTFSGVSASDDAANSITLMTTNGTLTILAPTAASVSVSGQLVTASGNGVTNATVVLTDSLGNRRSALSSSFGHFSFEGVAAGQTYTISVDSKRFRFSPQVVTVVDDVNGLVFVSEP